MKLSEVVFFVRAIIAAFWLYPVQRAALLAYGFKSQHDTLQLCMLYLQSVIIRIMLGKTAQQSQGDVVLQPQCVDTDVGTASRKLRLGAISIIFVPKWLGRSEHNGGVRSCLLCGSCDLL